MTEKKILFWGAGDKARLILEYFSMDFLPQNMLVFDTSSKLNVLSGIRVTNLTGVMRSFIERADFFCVCVGLAGQRRLELDLALQGFGLKAINFVHPSAIIETPLPDFCGIQVMPGVVVRPNVSIGRQVILNTGCIVEHDVFLGHGTHIMAGAVISGRAVIENLCNVGTNATVLPRRMVHKNSYVGAGAVVTKDVRESTIVVGSPATFLKSRPDEMFVDNGLTLLRDILDS